MKKIIQIMQLIFQEPGVHTAEGLEKQFGKEFVDAFKRFATGGSDDYVNFSPKARLTSEGVRELHRLVSDRDNGRRTEASIYATAFMSGSTTLLAFSLILSYLNLSGAQDELSVKLIALGLILVAIMVSGTFMRMRGVGG